MKEGSGQTTIPKRLRLLLFTVFATLAIGFFGSLANKYFSSTASVRNPVFDHYHFRTVLIVDGETIDFGADTYQKEYVKNQCDADISEDPMHFHDNVDQLTHVHWDGMTGGLLLKNYGWNFIGGRDDVLGWRFDDSKFNPKPVNTYGDVLPELSNNAEFYIYIDGSDGYLQKNWNDYLTQDFEEFFAKPSALNPREFTWLDIIFKPVIAHGDEVHNEAVTSGDETSTSSEDDLKKVNNLIGDVVIFAQNTQPTDEQIKDAFASLVPLSESTCGG